MKRTAMQGVLAATAAASVLWSAAGASAQDRIRVSINNTGITAFCMGIKIARHPKFPGPAKKYQLTYEEVTMPIAQAPVNISNDQINISDCSGVSTVLNAWNKGAKNMVVFAFGSEAAVYQLIAQPHIKQLSDLRGKVIGIPGLLTAGAEAAEMILKRGAGLLRERDYEYVTIGSGPAVMATLLAKKVDAVPYSPPFTYELLRRGYSLLADEVTYVPKYVTGTHIVSRAWAERNRPLFIRFLKSLIETGDWLQDPANERAVIDFFLENMETGGADGKMSEETAKRTYDLYIKEKRLSFNGYASEEAVRENIAILKERGFITDAEIPPLGQVFDFSYLNQALRELGKPQVREYAK